MALSHHIIDLDTLDQGIDVILPDTVGFYKKNCVICFDYHQHATGIIIELNDNKSTMKYPVTWKDKITDRERKAHRDLTKAAEYGACAIAFLLIRDLTDYKVIEQSVIGTRFDYHLSNKIDDTLIFNNTASLEISGILEENENNTLAKRVKSKKSRFQKHYLNKKPPNPAFIVVVDFKKPKSSMVTI